MALQINMFNEMIIDNFAGGGGASTGIELAIGRSVDIAINHDLNAIAMHKANHPHTLHYCESVWDVDPKKVTCGRSVALAWFSPDCKHFSKAKGSKPVNKKIRGLAWVAVRWAAKVKPRVIILENVEEFKTWGPVLNGQPIKSQSGRTFKSFVNELSKLGYKVDWRELRACDYGAPTIRKRLFLIARCDGKPIIWPEPTHGNPDSDLVKIGQLKPCRTAAEIIDWSLPCPSIFDTSDVIWKKYGLRAVRPLADTTMHRIARGIKKFIIDNPCPFIVDFKFNNNSKSVGNPLGTITSVNSFGLITLKTMPTLIQYYCEQSDNEVRGQSMKKPLMTIDMTNRYGIVTAFMSKHFGGGYTGAGSELTSPLHTITGIDHNALVILNLTIFRNNSDGQSYKNTIMTSHGHFGDVREFLAKYCGQGEGQDVSDPIHTGSLKKSFGLVKIHSEQYIITDIGMRMLTPRELFNAQGFPSDYIIDIGTDGKIFSKTDQIARCGNAVPPPFAEALVRANLPEMCCNKLSNMDELNNKLGA